MYPSVANNGKLGKVQNQNKHTVTFYLPEHSIVCGLSTNYFRDNTLFKITLDRFP